MHGLVPVFRMNPWMAVRVPDLRDRFRDDVFSVTGSSFADYLSLPQWLLEFEGSSQTCDTLVFARFD